MVSVNWVTDLVQISVTQSVTQDLYITCLLKHPPTEEIRLQIFRSPDWTVFQSTLWRDRDSRLLPWNPLWNLGASRESVLQSYRDSPENLFQILAVVIVLSPISSARGYMYVYMCIYMYIYMYAHDEYPKYTFTLSFSLSPHLFLSFPLALPLSPTSLNFSLSCSLTPARLLARSISMFRSLTLYPTLTLALAL